MGGERGTTFAVPIPAIHGDALMKNSPQDRTIKRQGVSGEELTRAVAGNVIEKQRLTPAAPGAQASPDSQGSAATQASPGKQASSGRQDSGTQASAGTQASPGSQTEGTQASAGAQADGAQADGAQAEPAAQPTRFESIQMLAYLRAERRGFAPGYDVEDWLAAEQEVAEREGAGTVG
jgi:hypothetical protein